VVTEQRILVFGGAGQVGHAFAEAKPAEGWNVVALSHEQADINDPASVERAIRDHKPSYIVNAASYTAVDKAESERDICMRINRDGAGIVARAAAATKTPLIHLSTDYVFDGSKSGPWNEDDTPAPLSVYGASKTAGEQEVRANLVQHVIVRTSWAFGIHGRNFVKTMLELAKTRDEIRIVADQHGRPTAAADIARGMIALAVRLQTRMPQRPWGTFHFAGKRATTWFKFAEAIFDEAEQRGMKVPTLVPIPTSGYPTPAKRPANSVLDCAKIESTYGVIPQLWSVGLAACLDRLIGPVQNIRA
jgi:dTDP-4-dehydrorhamnose reductase